MLDKDKIALIKQLMVSNPAEMAVARRESRIAGSWNQTETKAGVSWTIRDIYADLPLAIVFRPHGSKTWEATLWSEESFGKPTRADFAHADDATTWCEATLKQRSYIFVEYP